MNNIYEAIGEKIKSLREDYGIKQEQLAEALDISSNTISRWEKAVYKPSIEDLHKIANFFGVSISTFFPEVEDTKLQALMSATGNLDEEDISELVEYAKFRKARQVKQKLKS